jgi:uncharacterized membrane protein YedE/YeeE
MNRSLRTGLTVVSLVAAPALGGCATTYHPRPSPRIVMVPEGGSLVLEKNGHVYSMGVFSGGLSEAVQGNAQAEDEAASAQSKGVAAFVLSILGGVTVGTGAGLLAYGCESNNNCNVSTGLLATSISLFVGGIVMGIVSNSLYSSSHAHAYNAINIYNDSLAPGDYAPPQRGWAPQGYVPVVPGYAPAPPGYAPPPPAYAPPPPPAYAPPPAAPAPQPQ